MKKVLILSYYFPPCNLTAAQRIGSWEKYLPEFGCYPIIVTRNWTGEELTEAQRLASSGEGIRIEKGKHSEVHYLPYKSSIRDWFFIRGENNLFYQNLSKAFTLIHIFFQHFTIEAIRYKNLYYYARHILKNDKDIEYLIISVDPFEELHFGYLLKKEFPKLKWIVDYRDEWTTSNIDSFYFQSIQAYHEKKWVSTANAIVSVSPYYTQKVSGFIGVEGFTVFNGFDFEVESGNRINIDEFSITYNGTLYKTQPIEIFLSGYKRFVNNNPNFRVHLYFPGLSIKKDQAQRVVRYMKGYEKHFTVTDRLPKNEVLEIQKKSDLLLMVAHDNIKGVPSSKVFEYIGLKKPFIVCPGDGDILDEISIASSLGTVLNNEREVYSFLQQKLDMRINGELTFLYNQEAIDKFSVKNQVKKLSEIFDLV